ncbi:ArsR/SmtB family transcription factor [Aestuariimicrobium soli]|uniref:ArsR/SmtB family transcription factor n=1 Tax=Aestuariimicrobium soli TaxID=2035834 RepID=UPI003EB8395A
MSTPVDPTTPDRTTPEQGVPERTITDPAVLRAYAHPTRLRILDLLRAKGPLKVSQISDDLDEAIGSISHHLKPLEGAGLVERAPELAQDRRETWWRVPVGRTSWNRSDMTPAAAQAALQAEELMLQRQFDLFRRALHETPDEGWTDASFATSTWLHLTADELRDLNQRLNELIDQFRETSQHHRAEPGSGSRPIFFSARGITAEP